MKVFALGLMLAASAYGQVPKPCTMKAADLPAVRGFKLGQPIAAIKARFPKTHIAARASGLALAIFTHDDLRAAEFRGVDNIYLTYIDSMLARIDINYSLAVRRDSAEHFTAAIAASLMLPRDGWQGSFLQTLDCADFKVIAQPGLRFTARADAPATDITPKLQIQWSDFYEMVQARTATLEEKKRRALKP